MTNCDLILEWFDDYMDNRLSEPFRTQFENHLENCEACKAMVSDLSLMREVMVEMPLVALPEGFNESLHAKLEIAAQEIKADLHQDNSSKVLSFEKPQKAFERFRKKATPYVGLVAAVSIMVVGASRLGQLPLPVGNTLNYEQATQDAAGAPPEAQNVVTGVQKSASFDTSTAQTTAPDAFGNNVATANPLSGRDLVKTGDVTLQIADLEAFSKQLDGIIKASNGYLENSFTGSDNVTPAAEKTTSRALMSGSFAVRVPADQFNKVFESVQNLGKVESSQQNVIDVTTQITDLNASLTNLKTREASLQKLMAIAKSVQDIMAVEKELSDTRTQIDQLSAQLKGQSQQVTMAALYITVHESPDLNAKLKGLDDNIWQRAVNHLVKNMNLVVRGLENVFVWTFSWLPALAIAGAAIFGFSKTKLYKNWRKN